jgi:hypothetical protein
MLRKLKLVAEVGPYLDFGPIPGFLLNKVKKEECERKKGVCFDLALCIPSIQISTCDDLYCALPNLRGLCFLYCTCTALLDIFT